MPEIEKGALEKKAQKTKKIIVGVDEVGRGCIAGPVYAAAVILDLNKLFMLDEKKRNLIRDSKKLSLKQKKEASKILEDITLAQKIGISSQRQIEKDGIVPATFMAMKAAITSIELAFDKIYVDGNKTIPNFSNDKQECLIKGDNLSYSIAAASIIAKLARDRYMTDQAKNYPEYGFENHVGYGTKAHLQAIKDYGVTSLHRKNFAPISHLLRHPPY